MIFNLNKTYPGVKSRKQKKILKKKLSYYSLGLNPLKFITRKNLLRKCPSRGELVLKASGSLGKFVGVDPTGKVWVALEEYRSQFPYEQQCMIFDLSWRKKIL